MSSIDFNLRINSAGNVTQKEQEQKSSTHVIAEDIFQRDRNTCERPNFTDRSICVYYGEKQEEEVLAEEGSTKSFALDRLPAEILTHIFHFVLGLPSKPKNIASWRLTCKLFEEIFLIERERVQRKITLFEKWTLANAKKAAFLINNLGDSLTLLFAYKLFFIAVAKGHVSYEDGKQAALYWQNKYTDFPKRNISCDLIIEVTKRALYDTNCEDHGAIIQETKTFLKKGDSSKIYLLQLAKLTGDFSELEQIYLHALPTPYVKCRSDFLYHFVVAQVEWNLAAAKEKAYSISVESLRNNALKIIIKKEIENNLLDDAILTLDGIFKNYDSVAFFLATKLIEVGRMKEAEKIKEKIDSKVLSFRLTIKMHKKGKEGFDALIKEAFNFLTSSDTARINTLLLLIEIGEMHGNFSFAKQIAREMVADGKSNLKVAAILGMIKIAQLEGDKSFSESLAMIESYKRTYPRGNWEFPLYINLLLLIEKFKDFSDFKHIMEHFDDYFSDGQDCKELILNELRCKIAVIQIEKKQINQAINTIQLISSPFFQGIAYLWLLDSKTNSSFLSTAGPEILSYYRYQAIMGLIDVETLARAELLFKDKKFLLFEGFEGSICEELGWLT